METKEEIEVLYLKFEERLLNIQESALGIKTQMELTFQVSREAIAEFGLIFDNYPFKDPAAQVQFYKYDKPRFYSLLIFHEEKIILQANRPTGLPDRIKGYYEKELEAIARYFDRYRFLFEYYRNDYVELDQVYFIQNSELHIVSNSEFYINDIPIGYQFAKFRAFEKIQSYILGLILKPIVYDNYYEPNDNKNNLRWTGDVINLVELIYGIYLAGQINNGTATLAGITCWFEENLSVKIGRPHRHFIDITRRKRLSFTKFIDQMRDSIIEKVNNTLK